jgi:iron(III) transport system permease protein
MTLIMASVAFLVLAPLTFTILSSFQLSQPGQPEVYSLSGWRNIFSDPSLLSALWNTFSLAITRQLIALIIGIFLSWLIARTDLPWRSALEFLFWLSFFLPSFPIALGWILLLDPDYGLVNRWLQQLAIINEPIFNIYSFSGIVWVHLSVSTLGVKVLLLTPAFRNLDAALEESSHTCGAGTVATLARIVVPLMAPAIFVSTISGLIRSLEAFEIELLLGVPAGIQVYSTKIHDLLTFEPPEYAPATALSSFFLIVLLLLVFMQRRFTSRRLYHTVTGRGFSNRAITLGPWKYLICAVVTALASVITVVPAAVLMMGTFMTAFGYFDIPKPWTLDNWQLVMGDPIFMQSAWNTVVVGAATGIVGIILFPIIAYIVVKTKFVGRHFLDIFSWLPWAIPGIVMGLALIWTVFETRIFMPLYGTLYILIIAMAIKSMPLGVQICKAIMQQLGDELEEASYICGASWIQTYRRILIPILAPTLITIVLLAFIAAVRDISTIVLLGSSNSRTLALLALDFAINGQQGPASVVASLMVVIVIITALLARYVGRKVGIG